MKELSWGKRAPMSRIRGRSYQGDRKAQSRSVGDCRQTKGLGIPVILIVAEILLTIYQLYANGRH
jgi:hypothetical protein